MSRPEEIVLIIFAVVLGAVVGSFLNAVIHRLPRNVSLLNPKRSFCPSCQRSLPWYENLPLVSYLFLRGKCAGCGTKISLRYWLVELITALLFLWIWLSFPPGVAVVYWIFIALLITATFIDFEHFIIPDEITWGGVGVGLVASLVVPELMETSSRWEAVLKAALGAAVGYFTLWGVVEAGKIFFGRKKIQFPEPVDFHWERSGETASLTVEGDVTSWDELFNRASDKMTLDCPEYRVDDGEPGQGKLQFFFDRLVRESGETSLDLLQTIRGKVSGVVIPREAMGFGDVKFLAAIGAFLGWQAVFFTIFASSLIGCAFGIAAIIRAGGQRGQQIPFGPYLALGALFWLAGGQGWWGWYFSAF